jgi:predicted nuclease of predicted toxin-antitoxin system
MRVLLDENLPRKLKRYFDQEIEVLTVSDRGWNGMKNGALLRAAQAEFAVFITTDKGIPFEQNLSEFSIAIIILESSSNRLKDLGVLLPQLNKTLKSIQIGELVRIAI